MHFCQAAVLVKGTSMRQCERAVSCGYASRFSCFRAVTKHRAAARLDQCERFQPTHRARRTRRWASRRPRRSRARRRGESPGGSDARERPRMAQDADRGAASSPARPPTTRPPSSFAIGSANGAGRPTWRRMRCLLNYPVGKAKLDRSSRSEEPALATRLLWRPTKIPPRARPSAPSTATASSGDAAGQVVYANLCTTRGLRRAREDGNLGRGQDRAGSLRRQLSADSRC